MRPTLRVIDNQRPHPKDIARQRVAEWKSNAQRDNLPLVNLVDSGAPLLRRDEVLRASYPTYATVRYHVRRSLWSKLFRR